MSIDVLPPFMKTKWTEETTEQLIVLVSNVCEDTNPDWGSVAERMNKTPQECKTWYSFLLSLSKRIPSKERTRASLKKRRRRKASQINRAFPCQVAGCKKSYGTEGALKFHTQNKHKDYKYIPSYLHPYNANGKQSQQGCPWSDHVQQSDNAVLLAPPQLVLQAQPADVQALAVPQLHQFTASYQLMRNNLVMLANSGILPTTASIVDSQQGHITYPQ